jgi:hypothetical protein
MQYSIELTFHRAVRFFICNSAVMGISFLKEKIPNLAAHQTLIL